MWDHYLAHSGGLQIFSAVQTTGVCCSICLSTLEQMKHSSIMFVSITSPTLWTQHLFPSTQKHKLYFRTKCKYCWDWSYYEGVCQLLMFLFTIVNGRFFFYRESVALILYPVLQLVSPLAARSYLDLCRTGYAFVGRLYQTTMRIQRNPPFSSAWNISLNAWLSNVEMRDL